MQLIQQTTEFMLDTPSAVAIGKFDGIHKGHQALLQNVLLQKEKGRRAVVFTFDPPPSALFGNSEQKGLTTKEEKRRIFEKLGIDVLIEFPLTKETAAISPQDFVTKLLVGKMNAAYVAAGSDLTFGDKGRGNRELLEQLGRQLGFEVKVIEKICIGGKEVSSSRIRWEIEQGNMEQAKELIGFPYSVTGTVVHGRHLGSRLGMPTVNLLPPKDKLLPPRGVYTSYVSYGGKHYKSISNVGCKPTVSQEMVLGVETYLYDFREDIYGKQITVNLLSFRRPERRFASVEELKAQMQQDIEEGKGYMG